MDSRLAPLAEIFKLNTRLFAMALDGVGNELGLERQGDRGNSLGWLAGHTTSSRHVWAKLLGVNEDFPFPERFDRGANPSGNLDYPSLTEIGAAWQDISRKAVLAMEEAKIENLDAPAPFSTPSEDDSVLGALAFFALHESYHVGEMAYVRKLLGFPSLVG
ncbi:DinB family protein [bacterium]|nr:DinB family protein [bacterium]